jgi:hypothetical protein
VDYFNNAAKGDLNDVVLSLKLPEKFIVKEVSDGRYNSAKNTLEIGEVFPRSGGHLELIGETWGNYSEEQKVYARLDYLQESTVDERLTWADERLGLAEYQIAGSMVDCQVILPALIANQTSFNFDLKCQNNYKDTIAGLKLKLLDPDHLVINKSEPLLVKNFWNLGELKAGEAKTLKLSAKFDFPEEKNPGQITWELYGNHGEALLLDRVNKEVQIFYPRLKVTGVVNGQADYSPILGEELEYTLTYQNHEDFSVKDAVVYFDLSNSFFRPETISSNHKFRVADKKLTLDPLPEISSGGQGEIKFKIKTSNRVVKLQKTPAYLTLTPWVKYTLDYQGKTLALETENQPISNILSSNLDLLAFARYYTLEGEQLGVGPIPPIVGFPTKYRIFFRLSNSFNEVKDITISGVLPANVIWTGEESTNSGLELQFDSKTRKLSCSLSNLVSFIGIDSLPAIINFTLEINPLASQVGQFAPLLKDIKIIGRDAVTKRQLEQTVETVTTDLKNDYKAAGKGKILAQ